MSDEVEVGPASELTPGTVRGAGRYAIPFFTEMVKAIAEVVAANTPTSERLAGVGDGAVWRPG